MRKGIHALLVLSIVFFAMGLYFPILGAKQQMFGVVLSYEDMRLLDSVRFFYEGRAYILAVIIVFFTVIFPIVKYLELINRAIGVLPVSEKAQLALEKLDKWSMLDVFLVALVLMNYKMDSSVVAMKLKAGTTFIGLSVVLRMVYSSISAKLSSHQIRN